MVAKDRECVRGEGARRDMEGCRRELACDLIHIGDHQQQALGRGKRRRQRSRLQGPVHCARSSAFALHFDDVRDAAPGIRHALGRPLVGPFAHGRRRGDWIDGDHLAHAISDIGDGLIGVHGLELALH